MEGLLWFFSKGVARKVQKTNGSKNSPTADFCPGNPLKSSETHIFNGVYRSTNIYLYPNKASIYMLTLNKRKYLMFILMLRSYKPQ